MPNDRLSELEDIVRTLLKVSSEQKVESFNELGNGLAEEIGIKNKESRDSFIKGHTDFGNMHINNSNTNLINKLDGFLLKFHAKIFNEFKGKDSEDTNEIIKIKDKINNYIFKYCGEKEKTEIKKLDLGELINTFNEKQKKEFSDRITKDLSNNDLLNRIGIKIEGNKITFTPYSDSNKPEEEDCKKLNKVVNKFLLGSYISISNDSEDKENLTKKEIGDYILKYGNDEEKAEVIISRNEEIKKVIEKNKFFEGKKKENESYVELIKRIKKENTKDKNKGDDKSKRTADKYNIYTDPEFNEVFLNLKNLIYKYGEGILKENIFGNIDDAKEYFKASTPIDGSSADTPITSTDGVPPVDSDAGTSTISPVINSSANFGTKPTPSKKFGGKGKSSSQPLNNNQVHFGGALKKSPLNFGVKLTNPRNPFGTGTSSSGGPFGFVDLDNELPDALNKLYDLYIDFALAKSQPYNVYLYNKEHILAKQTELVNNIYAYCKSSGTNIGNQLVNLSNTLQSTSKINNEDLNVIIESIKENDFVRIYDALSHICMDGARDRVQSFIDGKVSKIGTGTTELVDLQNIDRASFDKGFSEHKEETLNNLATTCGKIIGNNNNFNSNDLNQLQNFKNETGVDYKEYPDVINHLARAGRVAENNLSNKNLTTNCADAWKGVPYSEASDNYVECVKNYNQYIMFDNIGHISFEINGCTLKLNLTDEQKNKFDMLELGKYTGRSIGLVPGIVGYLSSHPEIGIDVNNINECISISKNGRELTTQEEKNNVIMEEFVSDGFKSKISSVNFNQSLDSAASSLESRVISRDKSTAGKMLLSCFGENNQKVSADFVNKIKVQTQTIAQTQAKKKGIVRGM